MLKVHHLKTWPEFYEAVENNRKPFEIRHNDRNYAVGNVVVLKEFDPVTEQYTGKQCTKLITYILDDARFLRDGYVALGLQPAEPAQEGIYREALERIGNIEYWKYDENHMDDAVHDILNIARQALGGEGGAGK